MWDADHIVELQDGGPNTLENMQTLCDSSMPNKCHVKKTAEARAARQRFRTLARLMVERHHERDTRYEHFIEGSEHYDPERCERARALGHKWAWQTT